MKPDPKTRYSNQVQKPGPGPSPNPGLKIQSLKPVLEPGPRSRKKVRKPKVAKPKTANSKQKTGDECLFLVENSDLE